MGQKLGSTHCCRFASSSESEAEILDDNLAGEKCGFKGTPDVTEGAVDSYPPRYEDDNGRGGSFASNSMVEVKHVQSIDPEERKKRESLKDLGIEFADVTQDEGGVSATVLEQPLSPPTVAPSPSFNQALREQAVQAQRQKTAELDRPPGTGLFWVFVTCIHEGSQKVLCLRNCVKIDSQNGVRYQKMKRSKGQFTKVDVKVNQGDSFGQWCRVGDSVQKRLLDNFKNIAPVKGKANKNGVAPSCEVERALPFEPPLPNEDEDIDYFEDTQDRLPLGLEKGFNITLYELEGKSGAGPPMKKTYYQRLGGLPFGLPQSVDEFRTCPVGGNRQASGFVPHINGQQFCVGTESTFTWVRFDLGDLKTFDHNFEGVPVVHEKKGIIFPVTHLWVDLKEMALEWFVGSRCLCRKKMNLWFIPGAVLRSVVSFAMRRLTEGKFEEEETENQK